MTFVAYRFALDPTPRQARALWRHVGAVRVVFNWGLARVLANWSQREAERSYGIPESELTPVLPFWSTWSLKKVWNAVKDEVAPWWRSCSSGAYYSGLSALVGALRGWNASRRGSRKGPRIGFPKFKTKRKSQPAVRFSGRVRCERRHAVVPRIGRVKLHEDGSRLTELVEAGKARIVSVSVRHDRGRWFASFLTETDPSRDAPAEPDAVVGVDLGVKTLAVTSTGEEIPNPRHLDRALRRIRHRSRTCSRRRGPDRRSGQLPSKRWRRATDALLKTQSRVANQRQDALHKATTRLCATHGTLVIEDLNVVGMLKHRSLSRRIVDASFGEFRRQLEYKANWRGGRVIVASALYPSTKTCSNCGSVKTKLARSERTYRCTICNLVLDRDLNAARNLAALGNKILAGSGPESNGRGADRQSRHGEQVAMKRQPGTAVAGETGTVPTQDGTGRARVKPNGKPLPEATTSPPVERPAHGAPDRPRPA